MDLLRQRGMATGPSGGFVVIMDLFRSAPIAQPLAARLRATNLDEYVGQEHVLARGKGSLQ